MTTPGSLRNIERDRAGSSEIERDRMGAEKEFRISKLEFRMGAFLLASSF
jgi:hypothetical protein